MDDKKGREGLQKAKTEDSPDVESASGVRAEGSDTRETIRMSATSSVAAFKAASFPSWSPTPRRFGVDKGFLKEAFDHERATGIPTQRRHRTLLHPSILKRNGNELVIFSLHLSYNFLPS